MEKRNEPKKFSVTRNWKRFVAVGCTHAGMINEKAESEFFRFVESYAPHKRIHLGDVWDTTCWRAGAKNGADSAKSISADFKCGQDFLLNFRPTTVFLGNHDVRPFDYLDHPNAVIAHAASMHVQAISDFISKKLHAEMVDYDVRKGWREMGGTLFGHGYMYNEQAARDHAEMMGKPVVMAHIHTLAHAHARSLNAPYGVSAGCLIDIDKARYAARRRATHRWRNGWVYGEYCEDQCQVFLRAATHEKVEFSKIK